MKNRLIPFPVPRDLPRWEVRQSGAATAVLGVLGWPPSAAAQAMEGWGQDQPTHLIPTANHERLLLKVSIKSPLPDPPRLLVDRRSVTGVAAGITGRFWRFDVAGLKPATKYLLQLTSAGGSPLCAAWPLETFPAPDLAAQSLCLLAYTCVGDCDGPVLDGQALFFDTFTQFMCGPPPDID